MIQRQFVELYYALANFYGLSKSNRTVTAGKFLNI